MLSVFDQRILRGADQGWLQPHKVLELVVLINLVSILLWAFLHRKD
jgi:hypothetical protein